MKREARGERRVIAIAAIAFALVLSAPALAADAPAEPGTPSFVLVPEDQFDRLIKLLEYQRLVIERLRGELEKKTCGRAS